MIISASYRIGPFEVESALVEHPAVAESAVVGKPDPERTSIVKAFVVLAPGHEGSDELARELQEHVKTRHGALQVPARGRVRRRAAEDDLGQDPPQRAARARMTHAAAVRDRALLRGARVRRALPAVRLRRGAALAAASCSPTPTTRLRELWDGLVLGYTETLGSPLLRQEIAGLYETLEADDVIAVVGASEALFILFSALVRPGDHVIALWPAYQSLYDLARSQGADVELIELRPEDGWALDVDRIAAAMRPTTRAVVVNLPHNPTGMHARRGRVRRARRARRAPRRDARVRRGLPRARARSRPPGSPRRPTARTRAVSVGVLSKSYALAGLRVGWLATRDRVLLDAAAQVRDYTSLCSPAPSEVLGVDRPARGRRPARAQPRRSSPPTCRSSTR